MGLPRKLINITAYVDGGPWLGTIGEFEEPKIAMQGEDWRSGGMPGPVKLDLGIEPMEASITMGGHTASLIRKFGTTSVTGVRVRLVAAYRADDGTPAQGVEIYLGARFSEIDLGKAKPGDMTEHKYTLQVAYYRRVVDGVVDVEIDMLRGIHMFGGIDRYAEIMAILAG